MSSKSLTDLIYIGTDGYHSATYDEFLEWLADSMRTIYGQDINLDVDSQDGQLIAHLAQAFYDLSNLVSAVINGYSPSTAVGDMLSRQVKLNGIKRQEATSSTCDVLITGTAGTVISNGNVRDTSGNQWNLPDTVTIPTTGEITVTATANSTGAITAAVGTLTKIGTPTEGWISVTNTSEATAGRDTETDVSLRLRQSVSTASPSQALIEGITDGVSAILGVTRLKIYENDEHETDENSIPGHSISAVVEGGDAEEIAEVIRRRKTTGTGTYGSTVINLTDPAGSPITIRFFRPTTVHVKVQIKVTALTGYSSTYATEIQEQVSEYINGLGIGKTVYLSKLYVPANLDDNDHDSTYDIEEILVSEDDGEFAAKNVKTAFNAVPYCDADDVEVIAE